MPERRLERTRASYRCPLCGGNRLDGDHYITEDNPYDWTQPRVLCRDVRGDVIHPPAGGSRPMDG